MKYLALVLTATLVAGCGSSTASQSPPPNKSYTDSQYHFSFKYPSSWRLASPHGHTTSVGGVPTYEVNLTTPGQVAGVRVTVDHNVIPFPTFVEGKVAHDPNGGPDMFHYHHAHVSGWPAMQIQRYSGTQIDGMFTIVNTRTESFQVEMITANPPFPSHVVDGYNTLIRTLKLPFS